MKKYLTFLGWIIIVLFIVFSIDFIRGLPDQAQKSDWGIAKDSPIRR